MFNTYQKMLEMQRDKLAVVSINDNMSTFKYHRKVMYDYLWSDTNGTMECRGHTYDNTTGELIVAAPRKSFNYLENGNGKELDMKTKVQITKKYNGFLACVSSHNERFIVSTTGSTKSEFVKMAESVLPLDRYFHTPSYTDFYEIIHEDDPHIVDEGAQRAVYLGSRNKQGRILLTDLSSHMTLEDALEVAKQDRGEGFMMYVNDDYQKAYKLKSHYYVGKKKLMRMNSKNIDLMYNKNSVQSLPEMWSDVPRLIIKSFDKEQWKSFPEQERRKFLESIIK